MRRVLLQQKAFLNGTLYDAGEIVAISDDTVLAPYMTELPAEAPSAPAEPEPAPVTATPDKTVTVHYHPSTSELDIDVDGVSTRIDHATLNIETN